MTSSSLRRMALVLAAVLLLPLSGCGGGADGSSSKTHVRLLNLSSGYDSLDLTANNGDDEADTTLFTGVQLGTLSPYTTLKGDAYTLKFRKTGTSGTLTSTAVNLAGGTYLTLIAYGSTNRFALDVVDEDIDAPNSGFTKIQIVNTSFDQSFDAYLTGPTDSLDDVAATISTVGPRSQSSVATVSSGTYRVRFVKGGNKTDVRLNIPSLALASTGVVTLILTETDGGVLVNAIVLPKQGQPTTYTNTATSKFRVLNVSNGYDPVDVYTSDPDDTAEVRQFTGIARGTATSYATMQAATYNFRFRRTGAAGNLLTLASTLAEDRHVTYVSYGAANHFAVQAINEEIAQPNAGYTKLQVLNATGADSLDVYLTDPNDALGNVSAAVSAVPHGSLSEPSTVRYGSYRLRIARGGDKVDVRLDVPQITLQNQGVVTLILSETAGGVLLDAVLLPQQSEPVRLDNANVRIRGAVGLPAGSLATVKVGATEIVARRSARSFIGDTYTILPAGGVPVTISVDDVQIATQNLSLLPGRDYTLLVWNSAGSLAVSLIPDSNFASSSQKPRLRLLNGASGLSAPVTLLADYLPVAEYVRTGAASEATELAYSTDVRLDVINADTLATLLTRESVNLLPDGVYTLFVAGGGGSAVSATLRKDR